jgi:hypothetical protein
MISQKEQKALMRALDNWFDSQEVEMTDRAFVCAQMSGLYQGLYVAMIKEDRKYFERGTAILQSALQRAALATLKNEAT